jgi:E3 ubiquitin-protein ligase RFWD3
VEAAEEDGPRADVSTENLTLPNLALAALERLAENSAHKDDSIDDFRPLKKRKLALETEENCQDGEEGQTCSICFEPWSNSRGHRIASLKCGHLFGLNCIEKWVKGQGGGKCPQCNAKAKRSDIRVIFAKTVSVVDTTERDRALMERDEEKALRIEAQKAEAQAVLQYQLARAECERVREELRDVRQQLETFVSRGVQSSNCSSNSATTGEVSAAVLTSDKRDASARYIQCKTLPVAPNGGARVMAYDPHVGMLVVSKPSGNQLLPGYGLMKYSSLELGHGEYVAAHSGVIRDAVFSPRGDGLVLTAGMDKTCRLTSMQSNSNVLTYKTPSPVWACAWNVDDPNYLYAGLNGSIWVFDVRNTSEKVSSLQTEGERVPITSLSYVPLCRVSTLNVGGLLAGTLSGGVFWERASHEETFTPHPLTTIPGNCTCLSFEPATRHCMASFRPSKRLTGSPHSTHVLCQLCNVPHDKPFSCRPIHHFTGGTSHRLLSRSKLFQRPGGNDSRILAAFGIEENKSVHIWNASTMTRLQTLTLPQGPALDITPFSSSEQDLLAVLSETTVSVFHWQQQQHLSSPA